MKLFFLFSTVCLALCMSFTSAVTFTKESDCTNCDRLYDLIVVGGGIGGITSTYLVDLIQRQSNASGANLALIDISNVLLLESNSILGGNGVSGVPNKKSIVKSKEIAMRALYNYTDDLLFDKGPQRIPWLTARLQRTLAIDSKTLLEALPYTSHQDTRGRVVRCPDPDFTKYSPNNPYGMPTSCGTNEAFAGNWSQSWNYTNGIGPAFNLSLYKNWAYIDGSAFTAVNVYIIYSGVNPTKCNNPNADCVTCGGCFLDQGIVPGKCRDYIQLEAALIGELGHEATNQFIFEYAGFYGDFKEGLHNPCEWGRTYWLREWDTNGNFYVVGPWTKFIDNLASPLKMKGTVILNANVTKMSTAGGETSVIVITAGNFTYRGKFLIYAGQPEHISSGQITGNIPQNVITKPEFNAVYSTDVITVDINVDVAFWKEDLPKTKEWTLLRSFGDQGCIPRLEIRNSPYSNSMLVFRASYSDNICKQQFKKLFPYVTGSYSQSVVKKKLWKQFRNDIGYIFEMNVTDIPSSAIDIEFTYFKEAWYYINGLSSLTTEDILNFGSMPMGPTSPVAFVHQSWGYKWLGWSEASMRLGQLALNRIIPGSSHLLECWMYKVFPPCVNSLNCYNNPDSGILGTETVIPSPYCSERWWFNDFVKTPNCISSVNLTPQNLVTCIVNDIPMFDVKRESDKRINNRLTKFNKESKMKINY